MKIPRYQPCIQDVWSGRTSDNALYLHEIVSCIDLGTSVSDIPDKLSPVAIIGYPVDEGVRRNQGRIGAEYGPSAIRKRLSKLANHLPIEVLHDLGDIGCPDQNLEASHKALASLVAHVIERGSLPIVLGGGHDIALPNYRGVRSTLDGTIGIINLDAHLDLRTPVESSNSGTPFYDIHQEDTSVLYMPVGIQETSNHRGLFETAKKVGAHISPLVDCQGSQAAHTLSTLSAVLEGVDHIYLTIDMDGFSSAYSPGVSAPSPVGLSPEFARSLIDIVTKTGKLRSVDFAETCPRYDIDESTARLAAILAYRIMKNMTSS